jgi:linoleoyl-CoA desaturase
VKFGNDNAFQTELRRRVAASFRSTGRRPRDCPAMYLKTAVILAWFAGSYCLLVFAASAWWQCLPLAVLVGLAMGAVGFNIQHDGGHHAYSRHEWVNRLAARSLDLVGASSYLWHWKHGVFHHTHVNVTGEDTDIDLGRLARLTPHQRRRPFHRWQHL